jgi:riboflavin synthase
MFTGIITATTRVTDAKREKSSLFMTFERPEGWKIKPGDSICTNGTCLTVKELTDTTYIVELMAETLKKTTFGENTPEIVNLEQSLAVGDRMDGHFVTGHIDAVGEVIKTEADGDSKIFTVQAPAEFMHLLAPKGSVTIDGVALTVVDVGDDWFTVWLVDYTLQHTTLGTMEQGTQVNLEFDILAKYMERMLDKK